MLCVRVSCEDEGKHIQISCVCEDLCLVSCERTGYVEVWSDIIRYVNTSCEDVADHILICSEFVPNIDIWCSYVCRISDGNNLFLSIKNNGVTNPPDNLIVFISDKFINTIDVLSNTNWTVEDNK